MFLLCILQELIEKKKKTDDYCQLFKQLFLFKTAVSAVFIDLF